MEHSRQCDRLQDPRRRCRQKIKEHYIGASTLRQDRYHFWVQMAQADQTSISALETAVRTQADVRSVQMLTNSRGTSFSLASTNPSVDSEKTSIGMGNANPKILFSH